MFKFVFVSFILLISLLAQAKVYEFKKLYNDLGYNQTEDYFGSSEDDIFSLSSYTDKEDTFYSEINNYLRFHPAPYDWNGISPKAAKVIVTQLDRIFDKVPLLPQDIILYRGITLKYRDNKAYEIGDEFFDKAYISTSTTRSVAEYFATGAGDEEKAKDKRAMFALYFEKKVARGILFDQQEDEIILKHGQQFRIMQKKTEPSFDYYLVQICEKICLKKTTRKDVTAWWSEQ